VIPTVIVKTEAEAVIAEAGGSTTTAIELDSEDSDPGAQVKSRTRL
jgi:hypothetical protein